MNPHPYPPKVLLLIAALAAALATLVAPTAGAAHAAAPSSRAADKDCSDFSTQADAQHFFIAHGGPSSDPHRLDADGDGVVCESNPCPCSTSTSSPAPTHTPAAPAPAPLKVDRAVVVRVIDGDTVDVRLRRTGSVVRVRLIGVDTPEVFPGRQCGGPQASANAERMLPRGTAVVLTSDRTQALKDRYGRLLRYVKKVSTATDVGKAQLAKGHARVLVVGRPFVKVGKYRAAQAAAKRGARGIWGAC